MSSASPGANRASGELFALRIFGLKKGNVARARILGSKIHGIMTHFAKGKSWYCAGKECAHAFHRNGTNWKGYLAVEVFADELRAWRPEVLEITENLELDLRGRVARGQVWRFSCVGEDKRENPPVSGELIETLDPETFPAAFDIIAAIRTRYHHTITDFNVRNPMPERVLVTMSQGLPPLDVREAEEREKAAEERHAEESRRLAEQARKEKAQKQKLNFENERAKILDNIGKTPVDAKGRNGTISSR